MSAHDEVIFAALLREDFYTFMKKCFQTLNRGTAFLDNWHLAVLAYELEAVARGRNHRLIVNLPPRSMKSIATSVALVAWYLGHHPSAEVICASYGQDLSIKFAQDCRSIMQSAWYQAIFTTRIAAAKSAAADFRTIQGGSRLATSVGGAMTGRGGDLVIIDDPAKPDEMLSEVQRDAVNRWFYSTVYSRLNDKENAGIVVAMQRLHLQDLTGTLLLDGTWKHLRLPAVAERDEEYVVETVTGQQRVFTRKEGEVLHPARESLDSIERTKAALGSYFFAAQYQQTPMAPGGNLIQLRWFTRYDEVPEKFDHVFQSWDTASKTTELNSYSVCTTWGTQRKHMYLLDVFRQRLEYPDLKRAVLEQYARHHPTVVLVEDKSSGSALLQELKREGHAWLKEVKPEGSKEMRMSQQTALIEGGFVHLPKNANWLAAYESELMLFPVGAHADQVDSTSQALGWFQKDGIEPAGLRWIKMFAASLGIQADENGNPITH